MSVFLIWGKLCNVKLSILAIIHAAVISYSELFTSVFYVLLKIDICVGH